MKTVKKNNTLITKGTISEFLFSPYEDPNEWCLEKREILDTECYNFFEQMNKMGNLLPEFVNLQELLYGERSEK